MPETFGHYELLELLGQGGMGVVWRARDTVRQRNVALKVLPEHLATDGQFTARFRRESRLAAQLNEPHIVPIHDFGEIDGRLFIDMRLVDGVDLGTVLEQRTQLEPKVAVDILSQVASALDAAHADGLVHRDVKPSNVMLTGMTPDLRKTPFAYLVDFGIARSTQQQMTYATMTSAGTLGTVAYMSPERIGGDAGAAAADVYALACVLFETITGSLPYEGEPFALLYKHVNDPIPRPSERRPDLPRALDAVIAKGLAKDPDNRFAEAGDFTLAAAEALQQPPGRAFPQQPEPHGETLDLRGKGSTRSAPPAPAPPAPAPSPRVPAPPAPYSPPVVHRAAAPPVAGPRRAAAAPPVAPQAHQPHPPPGGPPPGAPPLPPGAPASAPPPSSRTRRRLVVAVAALIVLAIVATVVVLATRGSSSDDAAASHSSSASGDVAATPRSAVRQGGTVRWALTRAVANFNPYAADGATDETARVVDALLPQPYHYRANGEASVDTDYFTSITKTLADPLTIEYRINPKARWSDGTPVTYRDFAGLARAMSGTDSSFQTTPAAGWDRILSVARGVDVRDVIVTFKQPFGDWRRLFAPLVPASLTATSDMFDFGWKIAPLVTAGPFKPDSAASSTSYAVVRDPKWWGAPAKLDRIVFGLYSDQPASVSALTGKTTDYAVLGGIDAASNVAATNRAGGLDVRQYDAGATYRLLSVNTYDAVLSDIAVRRAIVHAIDRAALTKNLIGELNRQASPLDNFFYLQQTPGYRSTCGSYCTVDRAAAAKSLTDAGWSKQNGYFTKNGSRLRVSLLVPKSAANAAAEAKLIIANLRAVGIDAVLDSESSATVTRLVRAGTFQLTVSTRVASAYPISDDPQFYLHSGTENSGGGGSSAIDALLTKALADSSSDAVNAASSALWANASWLPLYERPQISGVRADVVNIGAPGLGDLRYQDIGLHV